ncbi:polyribonucleotide nucleotidyltransferase [bacterium]|nr:polyribonucleotide nucleotidyltransferase [bacterium]
MLEKVSINWGREDLIIETGLMARQADGSVLVKYAGAAVLTTVTAEKKPREGVDFLPLTVDYREKTYAAGKIPGGFFKRESRPGDKETLTSRLIDRPIRPMFPKGYNIETQIISMVLSADQKNDPDILAMLGAPTALLLSDIPFTTNLAAVRVGYIANQFVMNPTHQELEDSKLDMIVAATPEAVCMVECFAKEVAEDVVIDGIEFANRAIQPIFDLQRELVRRAGKPKQVFVPAEIDQALAGHVEHFVLPRFPQIFSTVGKQNRQSQIDIVLNDLDVSLGEEVEPTRLNQAHEIFDIVFKRELRQMIKSKGRRIDGRAVDTIRPIECHLSLLPMTHGSALFTRGETQSLTTVTLGTFADKQRIDDLEGESSKTFMLHYNFPPFSVGEVKMLRGPGRREIGHGMLAERAIQPLIPPQTEFPYTIRLVSEILESNGSSSMATVCASALALMEAGVPIKCNVAGIAMGLIKDENTITILSDILGTEDALGDMDLKVAGTKNGITAIQLDIKITGITREILAQALERARIGRLSILNIMDQTISSPRPELSPYAPRIIRLKINPDKIRDVIGPGGKIIKGIIEKTGAEINIEDDGSIEIAAVNVEKGKLAEKMILELIEEVEIGKIYLGKVKRIEPYGAFIGILPNVDGLLHISQIADYHVQSIENELKEGDDILVKLIEVDKFGRLKLSRKAALKETDHSRESRTFSFDSPPAETRTDASDENQSNHTGPNRDTETKKPRSESKTRDGKKYPHGRQGGYKKQSPRPKDKDRHSTSHNNYRNDSDRE